MASLGSQVAYQIVVLLLGFSTRASILHIATLFAFSFVVVKGEVWWTTSGRKFKVSGQHLVCLGYILICCGKMTSIYRWPTGTFCCALLGVWQNDHVMQSGPIAFCIAAVACVMWGYSIFGKWWITWSYLLGQLCSAWKHIRWISGFCLLCSSSSISCSVQHAKADRLIIVPSPENACPGEFTREPCLTLQQYVSNPSLSSDITLELQREEQLLARNINTITISATARHRSHVHINDRRFYFEHLQVIFVS